LLLIDYFAENSLYLFNCNICF